MRGLNGKRVLVTGAGSGIGAAIALRLAEEGASVLITGRTESTLKETADRHTGIDYFVSDISSEREQVLLEAKVKELYGGLDILINNAGVAPVGLLGSVPEEEIDRTFDTNVKAVITLSQR